MLFGPQANSVTYCGRLPVSSTRWRTLWSVTIELVRQLDENSIWQIKWLHTNLLQVLLALLTFVQTKIQNVVCMSVSTLPCVYRVGYIFCSHLAQLDCQPVWWPHPPRASECGYVLLVWWFTWGVIEIWDKQNYFEMPCRCLTSVVSPFRVMCHFQCIWKWNALK